MAPPGLLSRVFVSLEAAVRERSLHVHDAEASVDVTLLQPEQFGGLSPVAAPKTTIGPYRGPSLAASASISCQLSNGLSPLVAAVRCGCLAWQG